MKNNKIILASSSPRRIEMFQKNGYNPIIIHSNVDETIPESLSMEQSVMYLALKKGLSVEKEWIDCHRDESNLPFIIAADTIVFKDKQIGKPVDFQDAFQILKLLRNKSHFVVSGVAIIQAGTTKRKVFYETTEVFFKDYSDDVINKYIESEEVLDKAGAYAIQSEIWSKNIHKISGDYNNVMGLPWDRFMDEFDELINRGFPWTRIKQELDQINHLNF